MGEALVFALIQYGPAYAADVVDEYRCSGTICRDTVTYLLTQLLLLNTERALAIVYTFSEI